MKLLILLMVGVNGLEFCLFMLWVFVVCDGSGVWSVMFGGFVWIGEGSDVCVIVIGEGVFLIDVVIVVDCLVELMMLMLYVDDVVIWCNFGILLLCVVDNLFWLGCYLECVENILVLVCGGLGGLADVDGGVLFGFDMVVWFDVMIVVSGVVCSGGVMLGMVFGDLV